MKYECIIFLFIPADYVTMFSRLCALLIIVIVSTGANDLEPFESQGRFHMIKSSSGQPMCALDPPSQMLGSVRSSIECCSRCRQNPACQSVYFRSDLRRCEVFEFSIQTMNHISKRCQLAAVSRNCILNIKLLSN